MKMKSLSIMKWLGIRLVDQKPVQSHLGGSTMNGQISGWLMIVRSLVVVLMVAPSFAYAWPWSMDQGNQISVKPQESYDPAHPGMYPFPSRSVPVPSTPTSTIEVKDKDAAFKLKNPVPITARSVDMGHRLFSIYCVPCHGKSGTGNGYVGDKLILQPWNLTSSNTIHSWNSPDYPDGYIFGMITFGGAVMPIYAEDLSPTERWEVIDYVRAVLQKRGIPAVAAVAQKSK